MYQSVVYDMGLTTMGLTLILIVYTLPSFVAYVRNHKHFVRILAINVLFGFLVLPWIIMLAYAALTHPTEQPQ